MAKSRKNDRHINPSITLRLDPKVVEAFRLIADKEDRTMTAIFLRAMRLYAEKHGHDWPTSGTQQHAS